MSKAFQKWAMTGILGTGISFSCAGTLAAQEGPRFLELWGAVFAEEHVVFHMQTADAPAGWSLALSDAVVARGESQTVDQTFPPLRDGLAVEGVLTAETSQGRSQKPLWLFSRKPDFPSMEKLWIFDPIGATVGMLESNGIPFQSVNSIDALTGVTSGVVLVGEGISPDEYKGMEAALADSASRGARILWLAPGEGRMVLPGGAGEVSLDFRDAAVVATTDKRLKPEDWRERKTVTSSFRLVGDRRIVEMEWSANGMGWCWMEARWASGGRLAICGLSIVESWEDNPAPRYLLAQWLRDMNKQQ